MHGTVERVKINPPKVGELKALGRRIGVTPSRITPAMCMDQC